jgi:hypothetical protein
MVDKTCTALIALHTGTESSGDSKRGENVEERKERREDEESTADVNKRTRQGTEALRGEPEQEEMKLTSKEDELKENTLFQILARTTSRSQNKLFHCSGRLSIIFSIAFPRVPRLYLCSRRPATVGLRDNG